MRINCVRLLVMPLPLVSRSQRIHSSQAPSQGGETYLSRVAGTPTHHARWGAGTPKQDWGELHREGMHYLNDSHRNASDSLMCRLTSSQPCGSLGCSLKVCGTWRSVRTASSAFRPWPRPMLWL